MNGKLSINIFHKALQDETNDTQLFSALRRLMNAEAKQVRDQKKIDPAPLGSWGGWGF
jgi:hypothetical protein